MKNSSNSVEICKKPSNLNMVNVSKTIKTDPEIQEECKKESKDKSCELIYPINFNKLINNNLNDAILVFDENGILKTINREASILYTNLGYAGELEGKHYDFLSLDNTSFENYKKEIIPQKEHEVIKKEIKVGEFYYKLKTIFINEKPSNVIEIIQDITDIKNKEADIASKSVDIREIHHRVKNNLQTVASILRIQSRRCSSEEAIDLLNESVNRILAISATYELLSRDMKDQVKILDVVYAIVDNAKRYFNSNNKKINIEVIGEDFYLDGDRITAVSLIINELIQNCYDHGFNGRQEGNITINIYSSNETKKIEVIDDGIGFDYKEINNYGLGLYIVNTYIKDKLKGKSCIKSSIKGTIIIIEFPNKIFK